MGGGEIVGGGAIRLRYLCIYIYMNVCMNVAYLSEPGRSNSGGVTLARAEGRRKRRKAACAASRPVGGGTAVN